MSARSYLSIGDVLTLLRQEFPDVTISKIRFLESQGLVNPERTPSGYRKFYEHDVERLRWVLRQQREHFLPLKVIKDRLDEETAKPPAKSGANRSKTATGAHGAEDEPTGASEESAVRAEVPVLVGQRAAASTGGAPPVIASHAASVAPGPARTAPTTSGGDRSAPRDIEPAEGGAADRDVTASGLAATATTTSAGGSPQRHAPAPAPSAGGNGTGPTVARVGGVHSIAHGGDVGACRQLGDCPPSRIPSSFRR